MTTCPSCGIAGNNFNCQNHTYWGINPNLDLVPPPQTSVNWINPTSAQLFAEIGRLNVLLNERDKEIAALKQTSADLCSECGWRFLVPGIGCQGCERASLEQEIERLRGEHRPEGYPANNKKFAEKVQEQLRRDDKADQFRSNMSRFATSLRKDSSAQNLMDEHQMDNIQRGEHRREETK